MLNKKSSLLLGILLSIVITTSFLAINNQISEKISAQSKTVSMANSSASMMMGNKTAASSDVLMNKIRSMGNLTANATAAGPNMTK